MCPPLTGLFSNSCAAIGPHALRRFNLFWPATCYACAKAQHSVNTWLGHTVFNFQLHLRVSSRVNSQLSEHAVHATPPCAAQWLAPPLASRVVYIGGLTPVKIFFRLRLQNLFSGVCPPMVADGKWLAVVLCCAWLRVGGRGSISVYKI